jgi:hypothetical protein
MSQIVRLFANLDKHKPSLGDSVPNSPTGQRECKPRATDQRAILPMVGVRNGLIAGAAIWLAILAILAGMAS